jgi:hypothetical protein
VISRKIANKQLKEVRETMQGLKEKFSKERFRMKSQMDILK